MVAYEFSAAVTAERTLVIPADFAKILPVGESVRVILLVEKNGYQNGHQIEEILRFPLLEDLVAEIKQMSPDPLNITSGHGQLGEKLAHPVTKADPQFDLGAWTKEWDAVEAEMEAQSLAHEEAELRALS